METNYKSYTFEDSFGRLDTYLDASNDGFEDATYIPTRDHLTFTNGYYISSCAALYVDIRHSSAMPNKYTRPRLAKIYRSYISEVVAIINSNEDCAEVEVIGDAVYGVFHTLYKRDLDSLFGTAGRICSLIKTLNYKLQKRDIVPIQIGVGIDYGRILMIKAGYSGSGLNEVVWMGNAVNNASNLCHHGNETIFDQTVMVSSDVYENLSDYNKSLLTYNTTRSCYHAEIVNILMENWYELNCL